VASSTPAEIGDYALLSDCQSAALVRRDGSIDWWCAPRFDSPSTFGRLLDPHAGHFTLTARDGVPDERRYVDDTLVLETRLRAPGGVLLLRDCLSLNHARGHEIGHDVPHAIVRSAEVLAGEVTIDVEVAPRLEYGLTTPTWVPRDGRLCSVGGPSTLVLEGDRLPEPARGAARASWTLRAGERVTLALRHLVGMWAPLPAPLDAADALEGTIAAWRSWVEQHDGFDGSHQAQVALSARVLQGLTYAPTGAIVASPTTSLPEIVGGDANWDYRYAWLRDAGMTLRALWVATCPDEADRHVTWMTRSAGACGKDLQIVFGVGGERDLSERELLHLEGYAGSRPVRVGNAAWQQRQIDVYGEILDAVHLLRDRIGTPDELTRDFLLAVAGRAADEWQEPDSGIWEGREGERHFVPSKLGCWTAVDRAVRLADWLSAAPEDVRRWATARDEIRAAILRHGWNAEVGAFTGAFGSDHLDAAVLLMPQLGFLPASDERMRATIDVVERELAEHGLVRRWTGARDGAFVLTSFLLADCLARAGELDRAGEHFERVLGHANDVGLLAEEIDPASGRQLGNFPQGLSHVGLVNAAWTIDRAERGDRADLGILAS